LVRMEEQLTCPVCLEGYKVPKTLACNHTYCKTCLDSISKGPTTTCPICRTSSKLPSGGASALPTDTFKNNLLVAYSQIRSARKPDHGFVCELCDEESPDSAESRCIECSRFLCHDHTITHTKGRSTKNHNVVILAHIMGDAKLPLQQASISASPIYCKEHSMKEMNLFCEVCEKVMCDRCAASNHNLHHVIGIENAEAQLKEGLARLLELGRKKLTKYEGSIENSSKVISTTDSKARSMKADISRFFDTLQTVLDQRRQFLLNEVESKTQERIFLFRNRLQALDEASTDVKTTCEYGDMAITGTGNCQELNQLKNSLQKRLNKNEDTDLPKLDDSLNLSFPDFESVCESVSKLGRFSISTTHASLCIASGEGLARISKNAQSAFTIVARDKLSQPKTEGGDVFLVTISYPNNEETVAEVADLHNGRYNVTYSTKLEGLHKISVTLNGEHIQGSPFTVLCAKAKQVTFENGDVVTKTHGANGWNFVAYTSVGWKSGQHYVEILIENISTDRAGMVIGVAPKNKTPDDYKTCVGIAMNTVAYNMSSMGEISSERFNNDNRVGIMLDLDGDGNVCIFYRRTKWIARGIKKTFSNWQDLYVGVFMFYRNDRVSICRDTVYPAIEG